MLHCPRNIMRTVAYSGFILATCFGSAFSGSPLAADPTGDWKVADGVANIRVAECNGSMWGAVSWEKNPGGRDKNNPDASKQNRPTLGMPILIDMKKKAGVADQWEGEVYNAKDGKLYSSTIKPVGTDQLEIQGCVLGFLCGGETESRGCSATQSRTNHDSDGPEDRASSQDPGSKAGDARTAGRHRRRYLPTPRYRAVCPLGRAGTAAPRRASSPARARAACPCSRFPDDSIATGFRTQWLWSAPRKISLASGW